MGSTEIINENLIKLNMSGQSKEDALKMVADIVYEEGRVSNAEKYYQGMIEREKHATTGFGQGIAIPHAKIAEITEPAICVITLKNPVEWEALDNEPVKLIVALAVPDSQGGTTHLRLLSKLSESLMDEEFTERLLSATTKNEIYIIINNIFNEDGD